MSRQTFVHWFLLSVLSAALSLVTFGCDLDTGGPDDAGHDASTDGDFDGEVDGEVDGEADGEVDGEVDGEADGEADGQADLDIDGSDPCTGVEQCAGEGTSCSGNLLITCAPDEQGCLVETEEDCATEGMECRVDGISASCVVPDVCAGLDLCEVVGSSCDEDYLVTCEENDDGCLVETRFDCLSDSQMCGEVDGVAACVELDPCADIVQCSPEGSSCDGTFYYSCLPDDNGCLVEGSGDCSATDQTCGLVSSIAQCVDIVDPCEGVSNCSTEMATCEGDFFFNCLPDADGCLIEEFGFCSLTDQICDVISGVAQCVDPVDPCEGVSTCTMEISYCEDTLYYICAPDDSGCLIEDFGDCADSGLVCDDGSGDAECVEPVDPCEGVSTCTMEISYCEDTLYYICAPDDNGCLIEDFGDCADSGQLCDDSGTGEVCVDDPCAGTSNCSPEGSICSGDVLHVCEADGNGCLVELTQDCAQYTMYCDAAAVPPVCTPYECGNSEVDPGEDCEPDNLNGEDCLSLGWGDGDLYCTLGCQWDFGDCSVPTGWSCLELYFYDGYCDCGCGAFDPDCADHTSDSCAFCDDAGSCAEGATCDAIDPDDNTICVPQECPNDVAEGTEPCDGNDLRDEDCVSQGYNPDAPGLTCLPDCVGFDTSGCGTAIVCNNGVLEPGEECEEGNLDDQTCESLTGMSGELSCNPDCTFNMAYCGDPECGNDVTQAGEVCDGTDLSGIPFTCFDIGYDGGEIACAPNCRQVDLSGCIGAMPGWTCIPWIYGDGECDCGCGMMDIDCAGPGVDQCDYCDSLGGCSPLGLECPGEINPVDNGTCITR